MLLARTRSARCCVVQEEERKKSMACRSTTVVSQSDVGVKSTNAYGDAHGAEAAAERQGGGCALRTVNVVATAAYMS